MCENAFFLFVLMNSTNKKESAFLSVRKIVYIRSSLKQIPLSDAIHTSMIVATHVMDYDSLESQSDVDYVILYLCSIPWSNSHVLCQKSIALFFSIRTNQAPSSQHCVTLERCMTEVAPLIEYSHDKHLHVLQDVTYEKSDCVDSHSCT